jgi:hypothetical protein
MRRADLFACRLKLPEKSCDAEHDNKPARNTGKISSSREFFATILCFCCLQFSTFYRKALQKQINAIISGLSERIEVLLLLAIPLKSRRSTKSLVQVL